MIRIVVSDPDFLIVEKPSGIATQPLARSPSETLASLLFKSFPEIKSVGGSDWGAVHRLDRDTSGLVIFARNEKTYEYFRELFSKNRIEREYIALVKGTVQEGGVIDWPIGPDPNSAKKVKVYRGLAEARRMKAQAAVTIYQPLTPNLLRIQIRTGRRHQIRAHLAAIGHPVLRLHASHLRFRHPRDPKAGRWVEASSEPPFSGTPPETP